MSSILKPKSQAVHRTAGSPNGAKNKKLFPQKLWDLINDRRYHFCLRWSEDGQLVYLNRDDFEESYLKTRANQFHTQKAISFVRQMNMYGFRKVDDCYYENDNFKRDCEHLLKNMIRKHPNKSSTNKIELPTPFSYQQARAQQPHLLQAQQLQQAIQLQQQHQQHQHQQQLQQVQQEQQAVAAAAQQALQAQHPAITNLLSFYLLAMLNNSHSNR